MLKMLYSPDTMTNWVLVGISDKMSELDTEQNERIRTVENRINELENQVHALVAKLDQTMNILKIVGVGIGAMIGIDIQGVVM